MLFGILVFVTFLVSYIIGNSTKVPKILNYILLLLLIADTYLISNYVIKEFPRVLNSIITYLQNMASSLDAVILVALITGFISLANSFYSRFSENINKRREYLAGKREEPYTEFISLVYKITQSGGDGNNYPEEEMRKDIQSFNSKITLWGSPKVVKKWIKFRKNSLDGENTTSQENVLILIEEVMNEMRKDLGVKSVNKGNLLSIFLNDAEEILKKKNV
ncbi:hypothetical protein ACVR1I_02600 [Streptococcus cameli]